MRLRTLTVRASLRDTCIIAVLALLLCACDSGQQETIEATPIPGMQRLATEAPEGNTLSVKGEVWADNWFAFYVGERLITEDSTPITTERSFNAETFVFDAEYPLQLNFVAKDFKENDTGLEYIGSRRQQMGDGGLIAQFTDSATGETIAVTDSSWRCLVIHAAPLNSACADESSPEAGVGPCQFQAMDEPEAWRTVGFDDGGWPSAVEYNEGDVRPKDGYDLIDWKDEARLIWTADLERDNTLLCRLTVERP